MNREREYQKNLEVSARCLSLKQILLDEFRTTSNGKREGVLLNRINYYHSQIYRLQKENDEIDSEDGEPTFVGHRTQQEICTTNCKLRVIGFPLNCLESIKEE